MFGNRIPISFLMTLLALTSCARPKYELPNTSNSNGNLAQEAKASQCEIRFNNSHYCISWKWEVQPTSSSEGSIIFKIYRGNVFDDTPVLVDMPAVPELLLWMPSMGHGSSPTSVTRLDVGTYRASHVFFVMPGEWEIRFQIKEGSNLQDEAVVVITI